MCENKYRKPNYQKPRWCFYPYSGSGNNLLGNYCFILKAGIVAQLYQPEIFFGLQTLSSFFTLAPHFLQLYFGSTLSSNPFFLHAFLLISNFPVHDVLQQHSQDNCFANIHQFSRQNTPIGAVLRYIQSQAKDA